MTINDIKKEVMEETNIRSVKDFISGMTEDELKLYLIETGMINLMLSFNKGE